MIDPEYTQKRKIINTMLIIFNKHNVDYLAFFTIVKGFHLIGNFSKTPKKVKFM